MKPFSRTKVQANLGDDLFITDIYRGLLGRDPDEVGRSGFSTALTNGSLDRVGFIKAVLASDEYKRRLAGGSGHQPCNEPQGCHRSEAEALFANFQEHHELGHPGFIANFPRSQRWQLYRLRLLIQF